MRRHGRLSRLALASAVLLFGSARASLGACGDGVLQFGEVCDASAPDGDAACRGACIPVGVGGECGCAVPSDDPRRYVLIAGEFLRLGNDTLVIGGNAGVTFPLGLLVVGKDATMPSGSQASADFARLLDGSRVGRLFAREATIKPGAVVTNGGPFQFTLPLVAPSTLPPFPPAAPGSTQVTVATGQTVVLAPGAYGGVLLDQDATLVLRGLTPGSGAGLYELQSLRVGFNAHVIAHNPVVLNVSDRFVLGGAADVGPSPVASLVAGDVQVNVHGKRVGIGRASTVQAYNRAPLGNAKLGRGAFFAGRVVANRIGTTAAVVTLEGACGDGLLDPNEACDTSAPSGDVACPGTCIAGDPLGQGRIAAGQPGQCTCRCTSDAQCNDGNACNGTETCENNVCVIGMPLVCNDDNPCTRLRRHARLRQRPGRERTTCNDGTSAPPATPVRTHVRGGPRRLDGNSCSDQNKYRRRHVPGRPLRRRTGARLQRRQHVLDRHLRRYRRLPAHAARRRRPVLGRERLLAHGPLPERGLLPRRGPELRRREPVHDRVVRRDDRLPAPAAPRRHALCHREVLPRRVLLLNRLPGASCRSKETLSCEPPSSCHSLASSSSLRPTPSGGRSS
jgi:hypothetical protein